MADKLTFIEAAKNRRTYYDLKPESPISNERIIELAKTAIQIVPSSFNSQSTRMVVLFNDHHKKLWDTTKESLLAIIPEAQHEATSAKMDGFRNGYGTIMFFEDPEPINQLAAMFPTYASKMPEFSEHTSAMHQYFMWTALEAEGFGANLQHYSPIIDAKVQEEWGVDKSWKLVAQMVFGTPNSQPGDRVGIINVKPLEETLRVFS